MLKKSVIGIFSIIEKPQDSAFIFDRIFTNSAYASMVEKAGALPLIIPFWDYQYLDICDGFLFQGGPDIDPVFYNQTTSALCGKFRSDMDMRDIQAIHAIVNVKKPILGICRGHQIINVALGGTLYQDQSLVTGFKHNCIDRPYEAVHEVCLSPSLSSLFGNNRIGVNSLHHQIVDKVSPELSVVATCCEDGTVEALEGENILTVQWHPEAMGDLTVFKRLISMI